jgi:hypothetical protein
MKAKVRVSLNEDWRTVFDSLSAKLVKNSHTAKFLSKKAEFPPKLIYYKNVLKKRID